MGPGFIAKPRPPRKRTREERLGEIRAKASIRNAEALRLRREGLTFRAIGEHFGISKTMAMYLVRRGEREVGMDVSAKEWTRKAVANREADRAEAARLHAKWEAEKRAAETAERAAAAASRNSLKRAWGRWQVKMYQARLARTAEPGGDGIVLGHALQQLWRQFIEPHEPPVARPPPWLRWSRSGGVTYRASGQLAPVWRVEVNSHKENPDDLVPIRHTDT